MYLVTLSPGVIAYLTALSVTVGVEVPLWTLLTEGRTAAERALVGLGANLLTHGTLWSVWEFVPVDYATKLVVLETAIIVAEAVVCTRFGLLSWPRALLLSAGLNGLTIAIGLWLNAA